MSHKGVALDRMLTPVDIQNKQFPRSIRGYNDSEVDEYLGLIVRSMEELIQVNIDVTAKVREIEEQLERYRAMEKTINDAMVLAQKTSDDMIAHANEKAKLIINRAEEQGQKIVEEAHQEVHETLKKHEVAKQDLKAFQTKLRVMLESQLKVVENLSE